MNLSYLRGLNTLRFFAAFFVIISHANISLAKINIITTSRSWAFLDRGADAVEFFFVLSGFLITYLLLKEAKKENTISIKQFYLRRVFRIWPLYFLICLIGFVGLGVIYPLFTGKNFGFPLGKASLLYLFFLPNLSTSLYQMGLLYPLWSIGVEEQFYLMWAPLMKVFKNRVLTILLVAVCISTVFYISSFIFITDHNTPLFKFIKSLKFWAMSVGALFGYVLFHLEEIKASRYLTLKAVQLTAISIVCYHYLIGEPFSENIYYHFFIVVLYGIIILNTGLQNTSIVDLEKKPFVYLGTISYGLYMYHMVADYFLRTVFQKFAPKSHLFLVEISYYVFLIGLTIIIASLSYNYFESYFLKLKKSSHTLSAD
jgi:peptidoglycan/LPS O-acetylase OafA/YrhL